jgi:hypothetical protein
MEIILHDYKSIVGKQLGIEAVKVKPEADLEKN